MKWCRTCLMPDTRPRVQFTDGRCNACIFAEQYKLTDWDERKKEFMDVVAAHKKHPAYDCIVPFSGGKDSASIAHKLKHLLGLNPLLVCYGQLIWTDVGRHNLQRVCDAGFDIHYWRVNQKVSRRLARRFFIERGHPKQHYDAAVNSVPLITAVQFGIPLVVYAEFGEAHYGGHILSQDSYRRRNLAEVLEHQVGDDARNWAVDGLTERDLYPYIYPSSDDIARVGVEAHYFSYYFPWSVSANAVYAREMMGFEGVSDKYGNRSDASYENQDSIDDCIDCLDYRAMKIKFGFGRTVRFASRQIQEGILTREQGLEFARKYDDEEPVRYRKQICEYLGMSWPEIIAVLDTHRNKEIWKQENGKWELRFPLK